MKVSSYSLHELLHGELRPIALRPFPSDGEVHSVRKELKRCRAALRLLRGSIGEAEYRRDNGRLRDAGRALAPIRDAAALLKALHTLERADDDRSVHDYCAHLRSHLADQRAEARKHLSKRPIEKSSRLIAESALRVDARAARTAEIRSVAAGLRHVYHSGRRSMRRARSDEADAVWHEWRKQVKYLANEAELIDSIYQVKFKRLLKRTKKLADLLGEDHDLAVLQQKSAAAAARRELGALPRVLAKRIRRARRRLRRKIAPIGRSLYRRSPGRFERWSRKRLLQP